MFVTCDTRVEKPSCHTTPARPVPTRPVPTRPKDRGWGGDGSAGGTTFRPSADGGTWPPGVGEWIFDLVQERSLMPDNDPFDYTIEPPEVADEDHVRIVVRSLFDPTEPCNAADGEVRTGLRQVAGMLGRLAVHHFDGNNWRRTHPVIAAERAAHGCGTDHQYKIKTHCTVTAAGLVDPYAVLRADADPFGPLAVAPTVTFTVPTGSADVWRTALRDTLRYIARIDEWIPTDQQRRIRMLVSQTGVGCAPNAIEIEDGGECDTTHESPHWAFGVYTPNVCSLQNSYGAGVGTLTTVAAVYAGRREASCRMARVVAEMAAEIDRVQVSHGCKPSGDGDGCTLSGHDLINAIDVDAPDTLEHDYQSGVIFRVRDEAQTQSMMLAVRALLAEVDAVDAPVKSRAKR